MNYPQIHEFLRSHSWAITPEYLNTIIAVVNGNGNKALAEQIAEDRNTFISQLPQTKNTAVIQIKGVIMPYANLFTAISGGTSIEGVAAQFDKAMTDQSVTDILLLFDSPGGEITGLANLSDTIYNARGKKKIVSYVNGMAASAAYWIATAADEIVMAETAEVGSIGVMAIYEDTTKAEQMAGIDTLILRSSQSPNKNVDPMTEKGQQLIQDKIDSLAQIFIQHVARNRGVSVETVLTTFGKGDVMISKDAILKGMADKIANITSMFKKDGAMDAQVQETISALQLEVKQLTEANQAEIEKAKAIQEKADKELAEAKAKEVEMKLSLITENLLKDAFITPAEKDTVSALISYVYKVGADEGVAKLKTFLEARGKQFETKATDKEEVKPTVTLDLPNGTGAIDPIQVKEAILIKEIMNEKNISFMEAAKQFYNTEGK